jgi:hypothetical protein
MGHAARRRHAADTKVNPPALDLQANPLAAVPCHRGAPLLILAGDCTKHCFVEYGDIGKSRLRGPVPVKLVLL